MSLTLGMYLALYFFHFTFSYQIQNLIRNNEIFNSFTLFTMFAINYIWRALSLTIFLSSFNFGDAIEEEEEKFPCLQSLYDIWSQDQEFQGNIPLLS